MSWSAPMPSAPRCLTWATDIDVLPADRVVVRRDDHWIVRSPGNPTHWWGNLLLFDEPPGPGDGRRWERLFTDAFADQPRVRHMTFGWDRPDGALGAALEELVARRYVLEQIAGLIASPAELVAHPRANRGVIVRRLDPPGDQELWDAVLELQVAGRDARHAEAAFRAFATRRLGDLRSRFATGGGDWYVALTGDGEAVASLAIATYGRLGRFQSVETAAAHRQQGICSRLVTDAARIAIERHGVTQLVIAADIHYHALGLYESLGFARREHVCGVARAG